jgi:hypothetical protein
LFSETHFTKHCKRAVAGFHFKGSRNAWRFKLGDHYGGFLQAYCGRTDPRTDAETALLRVLPRALIARRFYFVAQFNFGMTSQERVVWSLFDAFDEGQIESYARIVRISR